MMRIVEKPNLGARTTLRLGGTGVAELILEDERDFDLLAGRIERIGASPVAWGRGSNILALDGEQPVTLVSLDEEKRPEVVSRDNERVRVRVPGGMRLSGLLAWCAGSGFGGLEPLAGIPGSVGGAVRMNAGSFGREMADVLTRVRVWTANQGLRWVDRQEWRSGYRSFHVPGVEGLWVVTEAELELEPLSPGQVRRGIGETYSRKKAAQPVATRTCGCVFKNPESGRPAGWLLEQSGFKGRQLGGVGFSAQHANFLVHHGGGSAGQALELIEAAREKVAREHGVKLELEVRIYPCP
jgi:UDP-N-acetylmuramate dehydrogenase